MDAFYAAVEVKEDAKLRGRPVVVGGTGNRSVVASASYEARGFGVHSAMPIAQARRLCPHAVFVAPRFQVYQRYSERFRDIATSFTPLVEGIGLDEVFLDVSGCVGLFGSPGRIAAAMRARVGDEMGLPCSVGAGPSKLVAKLASKAAKPRATTTGPRPGRGTLVVAEADVLAFLWPMPVEALWGVGQASAERLHKLGVATVGELAALPVDAVVAALGNAAGQMLHSLAWGRDSRPVVAERAVKSIGHEETYPTDIVDRQELDRRLVLMADRVAGHVREQGLVARTLVLKVRYGDFKTLTRSHTFASPQITGPSFWTAARALLDALELRQGVRLLGVSATGLLPAGSSPGQQLQLQLAPGPGKTGEAEGGPAGGARPAGGPEGTPARSAPPGEAAGAPARGTPPDGPGGTAAWAKASEAVDAVRARFGAGALRPGTWLVEGQRRRRGGRGARPERTRGVDGPE
jgi:DNA polymerase-4